MSDSGAALLCRALSQAGVTHVFGLPGTQNIDLFEELRRAGLRTVVPTHELAAAFMANGYYRASGKPGVVTTIPGPGFAYVLPALAEAAHDSAGVLYIVEKPAFRSDRRFVLQAIDQHAMAAPLVKRIIDVDRADQVAQATHEAYAATTEGEPGPVMLHVARAALDAAAERNAAPAPTPSKPPAADAVTAVRARLQAAKKPILFAGQGANGAAADIVKLGEALNAPVLTTRSARGLIPEDHALSVRFDATAEGTTKLNAFLADADLILAIGCKFSQNGAYGFRLAAPENLLVHVDASPAVLNANYPASLSVCADAGAFLAALGRGSLTRSTWTSSELAAGKTQPAADLEPVVGGVSPPTPAAFFAALREAMPREAILVTDTGVHQVLANRHFRVFSPRGFVIPTDFQSMGFGLPAALGAKLAQPDRPVVALIGDGGLLMCGTEIRTAVRERIPLTVVVFNDQAYGQIRNYQHAKFGVEHGTKLQPPDVDTFARSLGATYFRLSGEAVQTFKAALATPSVAIVEATVKDSTAMRTQRMKGAVRNAARRAKSMLRRLTT